MALVIGGIFINIWPRKAVTATTGFRYVVMRWGHVLTWDLLAVSFSRGVRGLSPSFNGVANLIAQVG